MAQRSNQLGIMADLVTWSKTIIGASSAALVKLPDDRFYIRKFPWDVGVEHPAAIFSPVNPLLKVATQRQSDYGHGTLVTLTKITNRSNVFDDDDYLYWRELLEEAINDRRIPTRLAVWCVVEPTTYIDPTGFGAGVDATGFVIRANRRFTNNS